MHHAYLLLSLSLTGARAFEDMLANGNTVFVKFHAPWCGFCKKLAPEWQKLAQEFPANTAEVDCTVEKDLCAAHAVAGFPTLMLYKGSSNVETAEEYTSLERDVYALSEWLLPRLGVAGADTAGMAVGAAAGAAGAVGAALDEERLHSVIAASATEPVFVKFYAPWCGFSKELAPVWRKLMAIYPGRLRELDCAKHKSLCKSHGVEGYPTLKLWRGNEVESYGGKRDTASLASWLRTRLGKGEAPAPPAQGPDGGMAAIDIGDKVCREQKTAFVKFHSPWCGFCKKLVPEWQSLQLEFDAEPSVVLAEVDCTKILTRPVCKRHGVSGYPTMLLFTPERDCKDGTLATDGEEYPGEREASLIAAWLQDKHAGRASSAAAAREEL